MDDQPFQQQQQQQLKVKLNHCVTSLFSMLITIQAKFSAVFKVTF